MIIANRLNSKYFTCPATRQPNRKLAASRKAKTSSLLRNKSKKHLSKFKLTLAAQYIAARRSIKEKSMPKKNTLDRIEIKTPCLASWDEMRGDDRIRFCDHCAKDVHNLSRFRRKDARRLVAKANGSICVQYVRRPDGTIETLKKQFHQITRQTGIAAGVLGTSLSFSALAYAQTPTDAVQPDVAQIVETQKTGEPNGAVSGTITDPSGAVIPFALVTLSCEQSGFFQTANSNGEGFYEFKNLPAGTYKLKFEAGGFDARELNQISVGEGAATEAQNAQLAVQTVQETVNVGESENVSYGMMGGAIAVMPSKPVSKLYLAVEDNNLEEVKTLVARGKRVNAKGYDGNSALHVAVENGNLEIAEILLNAGAKVNGKNDDRRTPLMMLDEDAAPEMVNLLLRRGAKINQTDKEGNSTLIFAASYATSETVQALISAGANVNQINKQGATALMNAAEAGDAASVQALLGAGANPAARNRDGKTAFDLVKDENARQFLLAYGAK
jgi:hypothetical protein